MSDSEFSVPDGFARRAATRGPYGTNVGDIWWAEGSDVQKRLDEDGEGLMLIHEVMEKDGEIQECMYVTKLPELVEAARRGTEKYVAQKASEN
jgi:hypothetical protein